MPQPDPTQLASRMSVCGECGALFGPFVASDGVARVMRVRRWLPSGVSDLPVVEYLARAAVDADTDAAYTALRAHFVQLDFGGASVGTVEAP